MYSSIEYGLIFGKDLHRVGDCSMGIMDLSDQSPLYLTLNLEQSQRNTLWILNIHILKHMKDQIKEDITGFLEQDSGEFTPLILLEACKAVLRGKISGYSSHLKRARLKELNQEQN